jgi:radical SAM protein with 4Fe4S-binding SPASM domain
MKAKIVPRIELENRTRLETVIPLSTPFTLFVDPSDACNFRCQFCPSGNAQLLKKVHRKPRHMDFDLFRKIIEDLRVLERPIKVLRLYKDGEPLLNPRFSDMIAYAKESGVALQVDTTTNGSLLNPEINIKLIDAGLDRINISVNGISEKQYLDFSGFKLNFDAFVENIRHFYEHRNNCLVVVKICGDVLSQDDKERFMRVFGDISDRIFIEHIAPCWPEFEMKGITPNKEIGIYGQPIREVTVCPYIFYSLSINSDGTASLCFLDWAHKMIVGDLRKQSFTEIWNGQPLFDYRKMHLQKKRKTHPACGACGQLTHCLPDDIDPYADMLLKRLEAARSGAGGGR